MLNSKYIKQACLDTWLLVNTVKTQTTEKGPSVPYQLCTVIHSVYFLNRARWWTFANSWVGWEGWGPLTDTHLSDMELFTTLFIQDKQYPHLLTFSIEHKCQHIAVWWQRRNVENVWMSVLNLMVMNICRGYFLLSIHSCQWFLKYIYISTWYYILLLTCHLRKEFYVNNKIKSCVWMMCFYKYTI